MSQIIKIIKKSVNSKPLFKEIDDFIQEAIDVIGVRWDSSLHRDSFVDLIDDWMEEEILGTGKVTQFSVVCDKRNNPSSKTRVKIYSFVITYKQKNCLNTTTIEYIMDGKSVVESALGAFIYP